MSSAYEQFSICVITKLFHFKVISSIILSEMSVVLRVTGQWFFSCHLTLTLRRLVVSDLSQIAYDAAS